MNQELFKKYREAIGKNPFVAKMGIDLLEMREGYVYARVEKKKELENIYTDMHGGCLYTIADNMAGFAAGSYGYYVTTVNGSIQYLKAARDTKYVDCEANVIKRGKTITVVHVDIKDDRKRLINTAEFTFFNLKRNPA